ncbi:hypothetical protein [Bacillus sp. Marseille-P3661]|uniref:hypothetical protein n=1 Tax=Bacillus sp. Marseille-P3661 TaxID=1936234 RepID=UPI000C8237D5|nr:hypothetical protein [Bacillus sp. Marseille-P3661]
MEEEQKEKRSSDYIDRVETSSGYIAENSETKATSEKLIRQDSKNLDQPKQEDGKDKDEKMPEEEVNHSQQHEQPEENQ